MSKNYRNVLFTYFLFLLIPGILSAVLIAGFPFLDAYTVVSASTLIGAIVAAMVFFYFLRDDFRLYRQSKAGIICWQDVKWILIAVPLLLLVQTFAANIEILLGVEVTSENTEVITEVVKEAPMFAFLPILFAPFFEEIVFRKIIMGSFLKRWGFPIASLASAFIFGLAHADPTHLIVYTSLGWTLAYLYHRTGRLIVPMAGHLLMNLFVLAITLTQL